MLTLDAILLKFGEKGEKTGWTYFPISQKSAALLKPGIRKSFRVKGYLDEYPFTGIALLPAGDGSFIFPLNSTLRKRIRKEAGQRLSVRIEEDRDYRVVPSSDLEACFLDEPAAQTFFSQLPLSHQHYFIKWIESARTESTRTKRMAQAINALSKGLKYGEMIRSFKK